MAPFRYNEEVFPKDSNILIVDDDPHSLTLTRNSLEELGFSNLFQALNGALGFELLNKFYQENKKIDLIFLDREMPEMTGTQFLIQIRAMNRYSKTPVIMSTSANDFNDITQAVMLGVSEYLVKPATTELVEMKMRSVWERLYT